MIKATTAEACFGDAPNAETPAGINAIGLQNPGVNVFWLRKNLLVGLTLSELPIIANVAKPNEEYATVSRKISQAPNVKAD